MGATVLGRRVATRCADALQVHSRAIRAFAGEDVERVAVEPIVSEMLTRPTTAPRIVSLILDALIIATHRLYSSCRRPELTLANRQSFLPCRQTFMLT